MTPQGTRQIFEYYFRHEEGQEIRRRGMANDWADHSQVIKWEILDDHYEWVEAPADLAEAWEAQFRRIQMEGHLMREETKMTELAKEIAGHLGSEDRRDIEAIESWLMDGWDDGSPAEILAGRFDWRVGLSSRRELPNPTDNHEIELGELITELASRITPRRRTMPNRKLTEFDYWHLSAPGRSDERDQQNATYDLARGIAKMIADFEYKHPRIPIDDVQVYIRLREVKVCPIDGPNMTAPILTDEELNER